MLTTVAVARDAVVTSNHASQSSIAAFDLARGPRPGPVLTD
jgi:hypothetical protein